MMVDKAPDTWDVKSITSPASESGTFIEKTFAGRTLHDTVYVTSNPHIKYHTLDFHHIENLLKTDWDNDLNTVLPADAIKSMKEMTEKFPNKRVILHMMQPHFPFIGPQGQTFDHGGIEMHLPADEQGTAPNPWFGIWSGHFDLDDVIGAYVENLEIVLPLVASLVDYLSKEGKTVVTADHGNLVGERTRPVPIRTYGHPPFIYHPNLITVPWVEIHGEQRRTITEQPPTSADHQMTDEVIDDRLTALGYK
ncbi:hypothetical protein SVXHr_0541 [Halorhabdus sp. SVX81]|nr:hypothetical protein SVXHr_0541 [Halorhabdus sp. SVX81]